jgi:hypothetical protein
MNVSVSDAAPAAVSRSIVSAFSMLASAMV